MKMPKFLLLSLCVTVGALLNSACSEQKTTVVKASPNAVENDAAVSSSDQRIQKAQALLEKMPDSPLAYNALAAAYAKSARETGDFSLNSKAEIALKRALAIDPDNLNAQKLTASLDLTFHRFADALELGAKLQKTNADDPFVYGVLTDANVELGNYKEAVDAVQKMVNLRPNMESYARVSYVRSLHGDSPGAIEAMSLAARIADPGDREAQAWCLARLGDEYFKIGRVPEAERQYDAALKIFPNYHFAVAGKGKARAASGDYQNAIKFYTQAQERVPLTETVIQLGDLYTKTGDVERAQKQYDLAVFIEEKFGNIDQRRLAELWADHDTKLDEALEIARAEHEKRKDIYSADVYAWCLSKKGQLDEARKIIGEAMRLKTNDARILYHAGMIEKGAGNAKEAKRLLQTALQTNPGFDILQAEKAELALRELK